MSGRCAFPKGSDRESDGVKRGRIGGGGNRKTAWVHVPARWSLGLCAVFCGAHVHAFMDPDVFRARSGCKTEFPDTGYRTARIPGPGDAPLWCSQNTWLPAGCAPGGVFRYHGEKRANQGVLSGVCLYAPSIGTGPRPSGCHTVEIRGDVVWCTPELFGCGATHGPPSRERAA